MHKNGQGCERNEKKAFEWYHKAAKRGHSLAQYNLGILYGKGAGVAQNDREALHWLEKAAGADVEAAQPAIAELKDDEFWVHLCAAGTPNPSFARRKQ